MNLVPSPLCTCGTEHILQRCPAFQHLRQQIWSDGTSLHQKLYGKKEELESTVGFIQQPAHPCNQANEKKKITQRISHPWITIFIGQSENFFLNDFIKV